MSSAVPPEVDLSLPELELELVEDISPIAPAGFLRLIRRRLRIRSADGERSEPFVYDEIDRRAIDAVVIAAHYVAPAPGAHGVAPAPGAHGVEAAPGAHGAQEGQRWVYLRSALRPPLRFRDPARSPGGARETGALWELPAGLIEPGEQSTGGILRASCRELREELGFLALETDFQWLGPPIWVSPGMISERLFFVHLEVHPGRRGEPTLDGSALERDGRVVAVPLERALHLCRTGRIEDAKTELGLRRLMETLNLAPGTPQQIPQGPRPEARSNE